MKKVTIIVIAVCLIMTVMTGTAYAAKLQSQKEPPLSMQVMGKTLTGIEPPIILSGKPYVPMRFVAEALGYTVTYNPSTRIMDIKKDDRSIRITIGSTKTVINGETVKIDKAPFLKNGRAYVPINYIETAFKIEAQYDSENKVVIVGNNNQNPAIVMEEGIYTLGKKADEEFAPLMRDNHIMIPLRPIGEGLGYKVVWNINTRTMSLTKNGQALVFVIDKDKATVNGKEVSMDYKTIMVRGRAYVPLTFLEEYMTEYNFFYHNNINALEVIKKVLARVKDIRFDESGGFPQLEIVADNPIKYDYFMLTNPDRMVIDIADAVADTEFESKEINKDNIIRVRIGQFNIKPYIARIVVDLKNHQDAKIVQSLDKKSISIVYANIIQPVTIAKEGFSHVLTIQGTKDIDSQVMRLDDPKRLVIDIQGAVLGSEEQVIQADSPLVSAVRTGQFDVGIARVVVDVNSDVYYDIKKEGKVAKVYISDIPYSFIGYDKYYNSSIVNLNVADESEYHIDMDEENKILKVAIKKDIEYDNDSITIDDNILEYIKLIKEEREGQIYTIAQFKLKDNVEYEPMSQNISKLVSLKLKYVPKTPQDILIVIDPGHGGKDPGAIGADKITYEKNLNLDVAKRLDAKLKNLGFKTIMTRNDDTYTSLQQRTDIANQNYADFFMSIHFNSFGSKAQGIETLYYPNIPNEYYSINNRDMAAIFQEELIKILKRPSRGTIPRPNLFVLNKTKMPAVLAELGFISNKEELSQIKKESYRDKAASALAASIVRYFQELHDIDLEIDINSIYSGNI